MSVQKQHTPGQAPRAQCAEAVDKICDAFERAWLGGRQPKIEDYLSEADQRLRGELLEELLLSELHLQIRNGIGPDRDQYIRRFPACAELINRTIGPADNASTVPRHDGTTSQSAALGNGGGLSVRCPQCHSPIEIVVDAPLDDIACSTCGSHFSLVQDETTTRAAPAITTNGHFELIERLGLGGFGTVWKARDTQLDRRVAVKIPRHGQLGPSDAKKFLREARSIAQLSHPNIVRVYEVGRDGDSVYIVSDLVRGISLADRLTAGPLTAREAAALCAKTAEALEHAHQAGVVHRDLKPQNIMVDADGEPILMDFGLARREAGEVTMTIDGQLLGTPAYMSPEQAQGEARHADRRSDIYSLGVILFELLTGERPFRGNSRMLIHQVIHDDPPSPRKLNGTVPHDLETICLKCLEKEPERRYDRAIQLADELRRLLRGEPILARPISAAARIWRWCKRRPAVASLSASVAILLLLLTIAGPLAAIKQSKLAADEAAARHDAVAAKEAERRLTFSMALDRGLAQCGQGHVAQGILWLAHALEIAPIQETAMQRVIRANLNPWRRELPALEAIIPHAEAVINVAFSPSEELVLTCTKNAAQLWDLRTGSPVGKPLPHDGEVHEVVFSRDGSRILTASYDHTARLWRTDTGEHIRILRHQAQIQGAAFSSDGLWIVTSDSDGKVRIWDAESGRRVGDLPVHEHMVHDVAISSDASKILTACHDMNARLWDFETRELIATFKHNARVPTVAFRRMNGTQIVTGDSDGNVYVWDVAKAIANDDKRLETAAEEFIGGPWRHEGGIHRLRVSPDGERILTASFDNTARLWDPDDHPDVGTMFEHQAAVSGVAFSPHGDAIVTACHDNAARLWRPAIGKTFRMVEYKSSGDHEAIFTADDRYVLTKTGTETALLRDAATGTRIAVIPIRGGIRAVAVSPDGAKILTGNVNGSAQLWDAATGGPIFPALQHAGEVWAVAFSPDGQRILTGGIRGTVQLRDARTGTLIGEPLDLGARVFGVAFSPESSRFAVPSSDKTVRLFDVNTGNMPRQLAGHRDTVVAAAFTPDGKRIVTGSYDNTVRVWNVATGRLVSRPMRYPGPIWYSVAVAFSPDGGFVVTGCDDRMVRIWDVTTARQIGPPLSHEAGVRMATFTHDDRWQIVTGTSLGTTRFWDVSISPLEADVERIVLWLQVITGMELDAQLGEVNVLDAGTWQQRQARLDELGGPPA